MNSSGYPPTSAQNPSAKSDNATDASELAGEAAAITELLRSLDDGSSVDRPLGRGDSFHVRAATLFREYLALQRESDQRSTYLPLSVKVAFKVPQGQSSRSLGAYGPRAPKIATLLVGPSIGAESTSRFVVSEILNDSVAPGPLQEPPRNTLSSASATSVVRDAATDAFTLAADAAAITKHFHALAHANRDPNPTDPFCLSAATWCRRYIDRMEENEPNSDLVLHSVTVNFEEPSTSAKPTLGFPPCKRADFSFGKRGKVAPSVRYSWTEVRNEPPSTAERANNKVNQVTSVRSKAEEEEDARRKFYWRS